MKARDTEVIYRSDTTVSVHLYNYAGEMWMGSQAVKLEPGDLTLTPCGTPTRYDLPEGGYHLCMHFNAMSAGRNALALPLHWRAGTQERRLRERMQEVIQLYRTNLDAGGDRELARLAVGTALQSLLLWMALTTGRKHPSVQSAPTRVEGAMERVRLYLDEHYRETISVPALAKKVGVSQNYLARRFREEQGMTLQRYLLGRRIDLARHLLAFTDMSLKAVAIDAALGNPQYFHRQFVRAVGHSPSRERELAGKSGALSAE